MNANAQQQTIALMGGTGDLGKGLATRWLKAGQRVIIGSRKLEKAQTTVAELQLELGTDDFDLCAKENAEAAEAADIAVLTVPFANQQATLLQVKHGLQGKILIDVTVPLAPPKVGRVQLPPEGSAGAAAQLLLGDQVRVVSAFQNVAAHHLQSGEVIACDVLVSGDDKAARQVVIELIELMGMRGFHAGPIANAAATEALTSILININREFKCHAGIIISGIE